MATGNTIGRLTAEPMVPKTTPAGSANPPEKKSWWSKWGDVVHTGLDILGAVPVVGIVADGANAAIYAAEGDYVNAAISGASAAANLIPGGGAAMKAGKAAVAVGKTVAKEGAEALAKQAAKEAAEKAAKEAAEKAAKEGAEAAGKKTAKNAGSDAGGGVKGKGKKKEPCKNKTCVGAPVNPVLGIKFLIGEEELDFELPAPLPLRWQRTYFSDQVGNGWLGQGWSLPVSAFLHRRAAGLVLTDSTGREVELPELEPDEMHFDNYESMAFVREANGRYRLSAADGGLHQIFAPLDLDADDTGGERSNYLPLIALEDRNGNRTRIVYGDDGFPAFVHDSAGRMLGLHFTELSPATGAQRRLDAVVQLHGEAGADGTWASNQIEPLVLYRYSAEGDLAAVVDAEGRTLREFRYRSHMLVEHAQPGGLISRYEYDRYDPQGRVLRHATNVDQLWTFEYETQATTVVDNLGRRTRYEFNEDKELVSVIDPAGGVTRYEYNAWGKPTSITDASGLVKRFRYDAYGNTTATVEADGSVTEVHYDEKWKLPTMLVDATGAATQLTYDAAGNLVRRVDAAGHVTRFNHDARGLVVRVIDAHGGKQTFDYDRFGQLVSHTDCVGHVTRYEWDARGNQTALIQPDGTRTEYRHDRSGRLLSAHYADSASERYDYDALGRMIRRVDVAGSVTEWELAADGMPLARTDALGHRAQYQYDGARRLVAIVNENDARYRFAFDANDNLVAEQGFDGRVVRYSYDPAGRVTEKQEFGVQDGTRAAVDPDEAPHLLRTQYRRDAAGRVIEKTVARAADKRIQRTHYEYDAAGRLVAGVNGGGRVGLAYDDLGQVVEETSLVLGSHRRVGYAYDGLGNRVETATPDGRVLSQRYYGPGVLHQVSLDDAVLTDIERDVMQRETVRTQGALTSYFEYDVVGRRIGQRARQAAVAADEVVSRRYAYAADGNLAAMTDRRFGQTVYAYDALGRVTRANAERFAFDPAHNIVGGTGESVRGNRVTVYEDKRFRYDTHGNLIEKRIAGHTCIRLHYDPEHRLERADISRNGVKQSVTYGYDAFGRRTWKRDAFGTTEFVWDGNRLLQELRRDRRLTYVYDGTGFVPVAQIESATVDGAEGGGVVRYFHTDRSGAPRELTGTDGSVAWRANYRVWGNTLTVEYPDAPPGSTGETVHQPLRFQGQYFDSETGLHYNRFRYYDPDVGRFVSQDPIGLAGGANAYQYAPNPFDWSDPHGLKHTAVWALMDANGNVKAEGIEFSGCDKKPGRRLNFQEQLMVHTERKIMAKISGVAAPGDHLVILGERPPCNPGGRGCQSAMDAFAKERGVKVTYMTNDGEWNYPQLSCDCGKKKKC
ncbi:MAG TPA: RHS repeat-associated core domain-containing protein [Tahibacter sp.]|uniref:RHS repeat-associated core domain-containing protein n=1 Tax=Tahibacter sp. TaxID=2056211 RepID=UPI002B614C45|nr:RHS repeat-associated core domain-containing protein [Tahibacter sp.]HSX60853.1 RHS repeat-associated core domain-containing protein [Tahibacter sp.]